MHPFRAFEASRAGRRVLVLLIASFFLFDAAFFGPKAARSFKAFVVRERRLQTAAAADRLYSAVEEAAAARRKSPGAGVPYPAESGARTTAAYFDLLVRGGYLGEADVRLCHGLVVAAVSGQDRPGTVLAVSRNAYDRLLGVAKKRESRDMLILYKSGNAAFGDALPGREELPPRTPAFLEP